MALNSNMNRYGTYEIGIYPLIIATSVLIRKLQISGSNPLGGSTFRWLRGSHYKIQTDPDEMIQELKGM